MEEDKGIKVVLLGEAGVGKTNLIRVAMGKPFETNSKTTISSAFYDEQIEINNKSYQYCLWDTAGQEVYRSLNKIFIKDSKVIIIVFSITKRESFTNVDFWVNYAKEILQNDTYVMALVGNKIDLYDEQEIPDEEIENKAKELKLKLKITSAVTDSQGFQKFLKELLEDYITTYNPKELPESESFMIKTRKHTIKKEKEKEESKCC
jgi:small GTP-binding protein